MPRPADISRGFGDDASPGSGIRNRTRSPRSGSRTMRGPNRVARFAMRFVFGFWSSALRADVDDSCFSGLRSTETRSATMGNTSRSRCRRPPSRAPPRAARARASAGASEASSRPAGGLNHPHPVCSRRPLRGRQRGSGGQRLARARARPSRSSRMALSIRAFSRARPRGSSAAFRALRRERGPGSPPRGRAPPVAVIARARASCATSRARDAPRRAPRAAIAERLRRTHGAHTIGRSGICGVREVGSKVSARGRGGGTGEREC